MTSDTESTEEASAADPGSTNEPEASGTAEADTARADADTTGYGELIRSIYGTGSPRKAIPTKVLTALREAPTPVGAERSLLLEQSTCDGQLEATRKLLRIAVGIDGTRVATVLVDFAGEVVRAHPLFADDALQAAIANLPGAPTEEQALDRLLSLNLARVDWRTVPKPDGSKQEKRCLENGALCLIMTLRAKRGISLARTHRLLQQKIWRRAAKVPKEDPSKVARLIDNKDPVASTLIFDILDSELTKERHATEIAKRDTARLEARIQTSHAQIGILAKELAELREAHELLKEQRRQEQAEFGDRMAHQADDYETLRGDLLRTIRSAVELLGEGLKALKRDPPKTHVMVDHAERVVDRLKGKMERLEKRT